MASVRDQNVFAILKTADDVMKDAGYDRDQRRAIIKELQNVSDNEMFHARLRYHFTVMADQVPDIDRMARSERNPYIDDCDNCDEWGICPDYREGAAPGATMQCDACGG
jgi:hypothetical protein